MMRSKLCQDGKYRIAAKVEVLVDVDDLTNLIIIHPDYTSYDSINSLRSLLSLNKRQLFSKAKDSIMLYGAHSNIQSILQPAQISQVNKHVQQLFPELK